MRSRREPAFASADQAGRSVPPGRRTISPRVRSWVETIKYPFARSKAPQLMGHRARPGGMVGRIEYFGKNRGPRVRFWLRDARSHLADRDPATPGQVELLDQRAAGGRAPRGRFARRY